MDLYCYFCDHIPYQHKKEKINEFRDNGNIYLSTIRIKYFCLSMK